MNPSDCTNIRVTHEHVEQYREFLIATLRRTLPLEDVLDILQELSLKFTTRSYIVESPEKIKSYLARSALNMRTSLLRKNSRRVKTRSLDQHGVRTQENGSGDPIARLILEETRDRLPPRLRRVFGLFCLGLSKDQVAARLGLSIRMIDYMVADIMKEIRDELP